MTGSPARLQLGAELFVAVPAPRARAVAYVLAQGAEQLRRRDGIVGLDWLDELLAVLGRVHAEDAEPRSEPALRVASSATRTADDESGAPAALWAHDHISIPEAHQLTGWSPGYLARLGRAGYGVKRGGGWHLDRHALLALAERRGRLSSRPEHTLGDPWREDYDRAAGPAAR